MAERFTWREFASEWWRYNKLSLRALCLCIQDAAILAGGLLWLWTLSPIVFALKRGKRNET